MSDPTTKLSKRLRELSRKGWNEGRFNLIDVQKLKGFAKEAEALEAPPVSDPVAWTDQDVDAAYLMGAINASGHEATGETYWPSMDRVKAECDRIKSNGWKIADMVRKVRGKV